MNLIYAWTHLFNRQKEYKEYASLERSKSQKLFARIKPGGVEQLKRDKLKEEEEYLEASREEALQRDRVNSLEDAVHTLQRMVSLSTFCKMCAHATCSLPVERSNRQTGFN